MTLEGSSTSRERKAACLTISLETFTQNCPVKLLSA